MESSGNGRRPLSAEPERTFTNSAPPDPEIPEAIDVGSAQSNIPFIPFSRISGEFRTYLEKTKMRAHPGIFPKKNWNDTKRKRKPTITAITQTDISVMWKEVYSLVQKYQYKDMKEWMAIYWFLSSCVLRAKIDCLNGTDPACVTSNPKIVPIVAEAKKVLTFQEFIMTEMMYRYEETTHQKHRVAN